MVLVFNKASKEAQSYMSKAEHLPANLLTLNVQNTPFSSVQEADYRGQAAYEDVAAVFHYEVRSRFTVKRGNRQMVRGGRQRALAMWMNNL